MTDTQKDQKQKIANDRPDTTVALFHPRCPGTLRTSASAGAKTVVNFRRRKGKKEGLTPRRSGSRLKSWTETNLQHTRSPLTVSTRRLSMISAVLE